MLKEHYAFETRPAVTNKFVVWQYEIIKRNEHVKYRVASAAT